MMKSFISEFIDVASDLDYFEIPVFIFIVGLAIAMCIGMVVGILVLIVKCPLIALALLISFGIPAAAIWHGKHKDLD